MKNKLKTTLILLCSVFIFTSCESEAERNIREAKIEKERVEKANYDKYINNSLSNGSTPYLYCYGENIKCYSYGCSKIKVKTSSGSDVLVLIKKEEKVVSHAYIKKANQYTFDLPNGTYQTFFYYGKGWNPEKIMKATDCGTLKGGFLKEESFGKDNPQTLQDNILEYELIPQRNGNFSTKSSNSDEAF